MTTTPITTASIGRPMPVFTDRLSGSEGVGPSGPYPVPHVGNHWTLNFGDFPEGVPTSSGSQEVSVTNTGTTPFFAILTPVHLEKAGSVDLINKAPISIAPGASAFMLNINRSASDPIGEHSDTFNLTTFSIGKGGHVTFAPVQHLTVEWHESANGALG